MKGETMRFLMDRPEFRRAAISTAVACCLAASLSTAPAAPAAPAARAASTAPVDCVNPFVGAAAHGHTYPGATVPFGMVQLSPDTRTEGWDGVSGYHYDDTTIQGFSHTHLTGTGCGDLGDILVMPMVGDIQLDPGTGGNGYASHFSHAHESASPGYYRVFLDDPKVTAELTATARCGMHRYTFPESADSHIIVDLGHGIGNDNFDGAINVEDSSTISGFRRTHGWASDRVVYFVMKFSKPFAGFELAQDDSVFPSGTSSATGRHLKAVVNYSTSTGEAVVVKVGISGASLDGARKNLAAEIPGFDFDKVHSQARAEWSRMLDAVQVEAHDPHVRATFYTNLYQAYLAPTLYDDVDGSYMGMDHKVHQANGFHNYTEFSIWDVYRAECPLLTILQPDRTNDVVRSMLVEYQQNGLHMTPKWPLWGNETYCMIGNHAIPIIVDAYFKGLVHGVDAETLYQAMRDTAMQDRDGLDSYKKLGYVASTPGAQATSKTLEYTFDDWCLGRMAKALGHDADARMFYQRAGNYVNVFDSRIQFMRGRRADGTWRPHFNSHNSVGDEYTEADAWQYAFDVQQDPQGMVRLYGGDAGFVKKMDAMFVENSYYTPFIPDISGMIGQYSQGDEQSHHVAYLYDYAGAAWKTQQRVRQVMTTLYSDKPDGQCGNIDCGQMTAWYIFSALGFYPVNPASGVYAIGSPIVDKATIHLDAKHYGGRTFTVIAKNNSPQNVYIQSMALNGKPMNRSWITHNEIAAGGTLSFVMGPRPKATWGEAVASRPPSEMPSGYRYASVPPPSTAVTKVALTLPIRIVCGSDDPVGDFQPDPDMDEGGTNSNGNAIDISAPGAAPSGVYQSERYASDLTYKFPVPSGGTYTLRLHFAEIFDSAADERVENVFINGQPALTNFDIYSAAGGMNKAVVEEFKDIKPDARGNIAIRISAAPSSPDQNAKISGIEILPGGAEAQTSKPQVSSTQ